MTDEEVQAANEIEHKVYRWSKKPRDSDEWMELETFYYETWIPELNKNLRKLITEKKNELDQLLCISTSTTTSLSTKAKRRL
jgi:hypothetical protein